MKVTKLVITLPHDQYSPEEIDDIYDASFDWLHDKVCNVDHGPNQDQGRCKKDFGHSSHTMEVDG